MLEINSEREIKEIDSKKNQPINGWLLLKFN